MTVVNLFNRENRITRHFNVCRFEMRGGLVTGHEQ